MNDIGEENNMQSAFAYPFMLFLVVIAFVFMLLMVDYYSTFTIKDTIDQEFKNVTVNEMSKKLTDEYSSDYIAKFDTDDKIKLEKELKEKFIGQIKADKGYIVTVKTLEMNNPSEKTITLKFTGTFEFRPMILRKLVIFDLPVESRAKVIRFDLE